MGQLQVPDSMLLFFVLAVTSLQQERFVDLLAMVQIKALQNARYFSLAQLVPKLIFQALHHVLQGVTMSIDS